jgi:hypothetical protein
MQYNQDERTVCKSSTTDCSPVSLESANNSNSVDAALNPISELGYAKTGAATVDLLDSIDLAMDDGVSTPVGTHIPDFRSNRWERYKRLAKGLPSRSAVERLVDYYFHKINWQYYALDETSVREKLHTWYLLDVSSIPEDSSILSIDLKAFPALLFELVGTSLLLMCPKTALAISDFGHMDRQMLENTAVGYSDAGMEILSFLGKRQISLTTIFTDFLRVAFLKYFGQVTEAVSYHSH